jgi:fluoride ion exporter CrcB/FEX
LLPCFSSTSRTSLGTTFTELDGRSNCDHSERCAALGIGTVGGVTGMSKWVASTVLPSDVPANPFVFALVVTVFAMLIHMVLGSVLAVMSIVTPAIIAYSALHENL